MTHQARAKKLWASWWRDRDVYTIVELDAMPRKLPGSLEYAEAIVDLYNLAWVAMTAMREEAQCRELCEDLEDLRVALGIPKIRSND